MTTATQPKNSGVIDFHAHILPGADHGALNLQQSLVQLAAATKCGVTTIVATPHFYPHSDTVNSFLARRTAAWEELFPALPQEAPIIRLGAEVLLCEGMEHMDGLDALQFGSDVLLLEMPMIAWSRTLLDTLEIIGSSSSRNVVLAHVDRYPPQNIAKLLRAGFFGQLNADALCRPHNRRLYSHWIREGYIVALGSDSHNTGKAYHTYHRAFHKLRSSADLLMERSAALLQAD